MAHGLVVGRGLCVAGDAYRVESFDLEAPCTPFTKRHVSSGGRIGAALAQAASLG